MKNRNDAVPLRQVSRREAAWSHNAGFTERTVVKL